MRKVKTRLVERLVKGHTEWWLTPRMPDGVSHCHMSSSMKRFSPVRVDCSRWSYWSEGHDRFPALIHTFQRCPSLWDCIVSLGTSCMRPSFAVLGSFHPPGWGLTCTPPASLPWVPLWSGSRQYDHRQFFSCNHPGVFFFATAVRH